MRTIPITVDAHTRSSDSISTAVVTAVAEAADTGPTSLPPLHDRIDPDALDALFAPTTRGKLRNGEVTFSYAGYVITVACDGEVAIALEEEKADE